MHLLIIEDERRLSKAVKKLLEKRGHVVDVANDGTEGFEAITHSEHDGIIMDIMMPGYSGLELLQYMREHGDETPVLLLTARSEIDDKVNGLELGADDYLTKPFEMKELIARVDAMTRNHMNNLECNDIIIDRKHNVMKSALNDTNSVSVSNDEIALFETLQRCSDGVSVDRLSSKIDSDEISISLYIAYLNRKLQSLQSSMHIDKDGKQYRLAVSEPAMIPEIA